MADPVLTTESATIWDLLAGSRMSLHLPRFALFLFTAFILEIKWGLKKVQWQCSTATVTLQLITGIGGIVAYYYMATSVFYDGDRVSFSGWYYPLTGFILLFFTALFIRGVSPLLKSTSKKNGIARCIIFALTVYFAITTIMTPHKINHNLEQSEKEKQNQSSDPT